MHREFKNRLKDAEGASEFVVAVNLDIRGFSAFSKNVESPDVAVFIKKVYLKLIDEYFPGASFFKPTGDGLLIIIPYTEEQLERVARDTIKSCLKVLTEFGTFTATDPMINFEVPSRLGIGLSRGTACCLSSRRRVLDYSGRVLNLATRLMDLARPSGIVFDTDFGIELLSDTQQKLFASDSVYIKGIAEREPIQIHYTRDLTTISVLNKRPLDKVKWNTVKETQTLREIKKVRGRFRYRLESEPIDPGEIEVIISHPSVSKGVREKGVFSYFSFSAFEYYSEAGKPLVRIQFDALAKRLESKGVRLGCPVEIKIVYPEG